MDFIKLHETIPYAKGGKEKVLRYSPYPNIVLAMPGRHALDTSPIGGDFVVMVTDPIYPVPEHQFTHTDIFKDVELKGVLSTEIKSRQVDIEGFMACYLNVIKSGIDPEGLMVQRKYLDNSMDAQTFMYAVQCLAVAEHRRYAQYESKFGGRYLPFRFSAGIAEGLWSAADAAAMQRKGRPGVEILERLHGTPKLTKELMS